MTGIITNNLPASAMQTQKHRSRTDHYSFISTSDVVKFAEDRGWHVAKTGEAPVRNKTRLGYQKHIVIMEKAEAVGVDGKIQLVIRNSHDGSSGLQLFIGYMRLCCANQIFSKNLGEGTSISIRHSRNGVARLNEFLDSFDVAVGVFDKNIRRLHEKILNPADVRVFAEKALAFRFEPGQIDERLIESVVVSDRLEDEANTAWNVMNRIQEKLVNGGLFLVNPTKNKMKRVRKLSGIDTLVKLNSDLIDLANTYA